MEFRLIFLDDLIAMVRTTLDTGAQDVEQYFKTVSAAVDYANDNKLSVEF